MGHPHMREGAGTGNFRNREKCHHLIKSQQWCSCNVGLLDSGTILY